MYVCMYVCMYVSTNPYMNRENARKTNTHACTQNAHACMHAQLTQRPRKHAGTGDGTPCPPRTLGRPRLRRRSGILWSWRGLPPCVLVVLFLCLFFPVLLDRRWPTRRLCSLWQYGPRGEATRARAAAQRWPVGCLAAGIPHPASLSNGTLRPRASKPRRWRLSISRPHAFVL